LKIARHAVVEIPSSVPRKREPRIIAALPERIEKVMKIVYTLTKDLKGNHKEAKKAGASKGAS
jgi:hypothetical protein